MTPTPPSDWLLSSGHRVVLNLEDVVDIALRLDLAEAYRAAYGAKIRMTDLAQILHQII